MNSTSPQTANVSILVPCCGQLEYTKLCVPSLLRHSTMPYELIFLDIGSLDGTADYLAGLAAGAPVHVEIVRTLTDEEIAASCAEALARATGQYVVLLNNDTLVTDSWLKELIALANLSPKIGMIGPMSNYAAPPQLVETVPYRMGARKDSHAPVEVAAVDEFARHFREQQKGKWMEAERLGGFCLFIKREVLTAIGPVQVLGSLEIFDTDSLCQKARQAGYTLAVARDLFMHHFGSRTFAHGGPSSPA